MGVAYSHSFYGLSARKGDRCCTVTPSFVHYRNPHIQRVWYDARLVLLQCNRAYIIGYSLWVDRLEVIKHDETVCQRYFSLFVSIGFLRLLKRPGRRPGDRLSFCLVEFAACGANPRAGVQRTVTIHAPPTEPSRETASGTAVPPNDCVTTN